MARRGAETRLLDFYWLGRLADSMDGCIMSEIKSEHPDTSQRSHRTPRAPIGWVVKACALRIAYDRQNERGKGLLPCRRHVVLVEVLLCKVNTDMTPH